jgi:O-antigen ligase
MQQKPPPVPPVAVGIPPPVPPVAVGIAPRAEPPSLDLVESLRGPAVGVVIALLTIYLSFNAGGFFPGATALATIALCLLLVLAIMLISRPFESFTPALLLPLSLLAGFAIWTLISAAWSGASGRALLEFDRALLYVLVFAFFGMLVPGKRRLEWGLRGFAAAAVLVCIAALVTRVAADVWPIALDIHPERLSFPLTYWNALGLLAALGLIACVHLSSSERESRLARVLGAAAVPLLASTLLLTFSRASLGLMVFGLLVYAAVARPRLMLATLGAVALPTAVVLVASYRAELVSSAEFASSAGVSQGHELALVVIVCIGVAAVTRALLTRRSDQLLEEWIPPVFEPRTIAAAAAATAVVLLLAVAVLDVPGWVGSQYDNFVQGNEVGHVNDPRERLTSSGNNGRIKQWKVALDAFEEAPLIGKGAGTYQLQWAQHRPYRFTVIDAHSLYVEALGEFGIVGFLLIVGVVVSIFVGLARRLRGEERRVYGAVIALATVWAAHAMVDWDWEMPVVTVWLFALAGLALAKPAGDRARGIRTVEPGRTVRIAVAIGIGVLAVTPAAIAISQSRLDKAVVAFDRGDCNAAIGSALDSLDALKVRPEPYELIGYCDARLGQGELAEKAMRNAVSRDPENWETHYGLALVLAAEGRDPMPQLYESRRLNPLEPRVQELIAAMRGQGPQEWERRAESARLPI